MNDINQLKLVVYESHMTDDDKFLCIDAIESCKSKTEFYKIHNDILDIVESANDFTIKSISIHEKGAKKYLKTFKDIYKVFDELEKTSNGELLVNADTNELVGCVFVGDKKDKGFISNLEVAISYRRQGYGTILLKDAIQKFHGVDLTVKKTNKPAIELYKKFGFREIHQDKMKDTPYYWMKKDKSNLLSESVVSTLDNDFAPNKHLALSKFKKVILTEDILDKINTKGTMICHLDLSDKCYGWFDKNKIVGYVAVSDEKSGRYITALEVCNEYKSHGLGKQILKFAVNNLKANKLTVAKTNQIAIKMYTDFGFKKIKDSSVNNAMITMKI